MEDSPDLLLPSSQTAVANRAKIPGTLPRRTHANPGWRNSGQPSVRSSRRKILWPTHSGSSRRYHSDTHIPPRKEAHLEMGQMGRYVGRSESTAGPLQEDRLASTARSRERKTKTRLDPTLMAHTQHNRENQELDNYRRRVRLARTTHSLQ